MQLLGSDLKVRSQRQSVATLPPNWWQIKQPVASDYMPSDTSLRHAKIKSEVRKGNVEHILPMIAMKARATWDKLPKFAQVWFSVEDLIAEGSAHVSSKKFISLHKNNGPAGFVTYCWVALDNLYKDRLKAVYTDKRFVRSIYSGDSTITIGDKSGKLRCLFDELADPRERANHIRANELRIIARIDTERAFLRLYAQSNSQMRRYLIMWVLQPSNTKFKKLRYSESKGRVVGDMPLFARIKEDFKSTQLSMEHCETIQNDFDCRRNIARQLVKRFRTRKSGVEKPDSPTFENSIESLVAKIAFSKPLYERGSKRRW